MFKDREIPKPKLTGFVCAVENCKPNSSSIVGVHAPEYMDLLFKVYHEFIPPIFQELPLKMSRAYENHWFLLAEGRL